MYKIGLENLIVPQSKDAIKGPCQKTLGPMSRDSHQVRWKNLSKLVTQSSQWTEIHQMSLNVWTHSKTLNPKSFICSLWRILGTDLLLKISKWREWIKSCLSYEDCSWANDTADEGKFLLTVDKILLFWNSNEIMDIGNNKESWCPR